MSKKKDSIPNLDRVFSNGHWSKKVMTVAEAIAELKRLPPDLPVKSEVNGVDIVVFNRPGSSNPVGTHVSFEDGGSWDDWDGNGDADKK